QLPLVEFVALIFLERVVVEFLRCQERLRRSVHTSSVVGPGRLPPHPGLPIPELCSSPPPPLGRAEPANPARCRCACRRASGDRSKRRSPRTTSRARPSERSAATASPARTRRGFHRIVSDAPPALNCFPRAPPARRASRGTRP